MLLSGEAGAAPAGAARVTSYSATDRLAGTAGLWHSFAAMVPATPTAVAAGFGYYVPYLWPWGFAPSQCGIEVTVGAVSAHLRLAVYAMRPDMGIGARLGLAADLDASSAALKSAPLPVSGWQGPGMYYAGLAVDVAGVTVKAAATIASVLPVRTTGVYPLTVFRAETYAASLPDPGPSMTLLSPGSSAWGVLLGVP